MTANMNCKKARPLFSLLEGGELEGQVAGGVRGHLEGCSECRGLAARSRRLQALLALKRHEQPDEFYFRTFLSGFHRRLYADIVRRKSLWSTIRAALELDHRVGFALRAATLCAGGALVSLSLYTSHLSLQTNADQLAMNASDRSSRGVAHPVESSWSEVAVADHRAQTRTKYVLDRVSYSPTLHETSVLSF